MIIHVRLHTILRRQTPDGIVDRLDLELDEGASVGGALERLGIQLQGRSVLLVLNGELVQRDVLLHDGDQLRLVPSVSGGRHDLLDR